MSGYFLFNVQEDTDPLPIVLPPKKARGALRSEKLLIRAANGSAHAQNVETSGETVA